MRELRFVSGAGGPGGPAGNQHIVVETADGAEQFTLRIDDLYRHLPPQPAPSAEAVAPSPIPPREIQMRVRAGEAPHELAEESGVSIDRVLMFAGPVLDERSRMADEARRARARRSTPDGQLVNFGEAVDERFAAHGIDPMAVRWDSHRRDDGQWIVSAGWRGGESERTAEWSFSLAARAVTPMDETASDLLSDRPIRPVVAAVPDLPLASTSTADAPTGPLPMMTSQPPMANHPSTSKASNQPFVADRPAAGDEDRFTPPTVSEEAPPLPLRVVDETEEQKAARARIPSWDDILLGVRRKRD
ncbi:MAG TPA: septation protein SepH [Jatrophihabitantaceae bacterium]